MIDIKGLDKAKVLAALFNRSKQQGYGFLDRSGQSQMSIDDARVCLLENTRKRYSGREEVYFDYLRGRVMKLDLTSDNEFDPSLYDRDNGEGTAQTVIDMLRSTKT